MRNAKLLIALVLGGLIGGFFTGSAPIGLIAGLAMAAVWILAGWLGRGPLASDDSAKG